MYELSLEVRGRPLLSPVLTACLTTLALPLPELNAALLARAEENPFLEVLAWPRPAAPPSADTRVPSLEEAVVRQLRLERLRPSVRAAAYALLRHLDRRGYLADTLPEVARAEGMAPSLLEEARQVLLHLEPPGLAARDAREALAAALEHRRQVAPGAAVDLALALLAEGRLEEGPLRRPRGPGDPALAAALALLRSLPPYPAAPFEPAADPVLFPDFVVRLEAGTPEIALNRGGSVRLGFHDLFGGAARRRRPQAAPFPLLAREARLILYALRRRQATLERLAAHLAARQAGFLTGGRRRLLPLTMEETARELGVDPSTVSRAVQGKTLATPHGTYPLKTLFPGNCARSPLSLPASRDQVKEELSDLRRRHPDLSDRALQEELKGRGLVVSRRTIAKYRKELGLPSSRKGG